MDNDLNDDDLLRLNALVDGELAPADRAEIAARLAVDRDLARAYATLAQLKATLGDSTGDTPVFTLPPARRAIRWRLGFAAAACVIGVIGIGFLIKSGLPSDGGLATDVAEGPTAIIHASLPAGTTIPRLDTAGLNLIGLAIDPGKVLLFTASYRGPHGCRLDLRAWRVGAEAPPVTGTSQHQWTTGGLVYELVAHGMPPWRFAIIADAAEQQTRQGDPDRVDRRLRQAAIGAPPCLG